MSKTSPYDPGVYGSTLYYLVEIVYEVKNAPGVKAACMWAGYDFPHHAPALNAFLARLKEERGAALTTQVKAAWRVDHRLTTFAGATATLN